MESCLTQPNTYFCHAHSCLDLIIWDMTLLFILWILTRSCYYARILWRINSLSLIFCLWFFISHVNMLFMLHFLQLNQVLWAKEFINDPISNTTLNYSDKWLVLQHESWILLAFYFDYYILSGQQFHRSTNPRAVLIMDEVDGMSAGDRVGVADLIASINICSIPIICICNDRYSQKLKSLVNYCLMLNFRKPTKQQVISCHVQFQWGNDLQNYYCSLELQEPSTTLLTFVVSWHAQCS